jgi:hypothetical protein
MRHQRPTMRVEMSGQARIEINLGSVLDRLARALHALLRWRLFRIFFPQ